MTYTTISVKGKTKKELKELQSLYKTRSMDELLKILIAQAKKNYINEFSIDFQAKLKERNLSIEGIIKSGEKIREEILNEKK